MFVGALIIEIELLWFLYQKLLMGILNVNIKPKITLLEKRVKNLILYINTFNPNDSSH
jgi:hypothetical protein